MRKNEKIKRIGIEATLFLILLFIIKIGYPIEYTSRQYFQEVLNQRDQDSTISCSERVLGLSSMYRIFCGIDELAVYNYFPDQSINQDLYITSTITNNHWIQLVMQEGEITTLKIEVKETKLQAQQVQLINMLADSNYRDGHLFLTIRKTNQKGMIVFNGIEKEPLFIFVDTPITRYDEKNSKRFEGYHRGNYILPEAVQKVYIPLVLC